ncbi:isoprenylcysteine carboxylmethyltransferase family protein [Xylanimonas oleitrophica]|uniref:Isoprenylcysteine carboxylmethyltransferase family protein n=1 Tax=Xylanimonas oleitrophica TaxID=2607479 RepID=A0A2W5WMP9_9MICO|nr:methyltransferase [Xylanimonas oleitrophica]PZR52013.1 isoprenylcysteine carboxylmethyltransferase family protein [Xylanimonas oleitrophica]
MNDPALVRGVGLAVPLVLLVALCAHRRPTSREVAAMLTATAWAALALLPLNLAAPSLGWWAFDAVGAVWLGLPLDLWLAWALLWGAVPALALRHLSPLLVGALLVWVDLALMPLGEPVVLLGARWDGGRHWIVGEAVAVMVALVPALALARWTRSRRRTLLRGWAQAVAAGGLMLGLPVAVLVAASGTLPPRGVLGTGAQLALAAALPGLAAMRELAVVGRGTPLPFDPPSRLVTSGPYAYLRNPMQAAVAGTYVVAAGTLAEPCLLLGAVVTVVYSAGLADWHEDRALRGAFGEAWLGYRTAVRPWLPRWRPWPGRPRATVYVAGDCDLCSGVGAWLLARSPVALTVRPAAEHPEVLFRMTYEAPGVRTEGVAAFARAVEHAHLGWALAGWALSLPGVRHLAQLCADAFGAGPRPSCAGELSGVSPGR